MPRVPFDPATDYYQLLGVPPGASTEEIQAAYRRLAKAYHPDLNDGSAVAAARMARVNVAKSVLLDRATRASYDQVRASRLRVVRVNGAAVGAATGVVDGAATTARYVPTVSPNGVGRPRYRVVRATQTGAMQRGSLDRQTGVLLLIVVPLLAALLVYVFQAVQLSSQPQRTVPADVVRVPGGPANPVGPGGQPGPGQPGPGQPGRSIRPTARGTAASAFSMLHAQPPSQELATSVYDLIASRFDGTPTSQQLLADGHRLSRAAAAGDTQAWDTAVYDVCRLAGQC
jgi:hypothetical protein